MHFILKEEPHCHNCHHLKPKRKGHKCKAYWEDIHPEVAGHHVEVIDHQHRRFKIHCTKYHPKEHVKQG